MEWTVEEDGEWYHPDTEMRKRLHVPIGCCPNYLEDLNAVHEAEGKLTPAQQAVFGENLATLFHYHDDYYSGWTVGPIDFYMMAHATATQRCEALLKTLGLWRD